MAMIYRPEEGSQKHKGNKYHRTINISLLQYTNEYIVNTEYDRYFRLWADVIKQAVRDRDLTFFRSEYFIQICNMINLDSNMVIEGLSPRLKQRILKK